MDMMSDSTRGRDVRAKLIKVCEPNFRDDIQIVFELDGKLHSCRPAWLVRDEEIAAMSDEDAAQVRVAVARNPKPAPKSEAEIAEGKAFNEAKWGAFDDEDARSFAGGRGVHW
jgi:hypothetical protein